MWDSLRDWFLGLGAQYGVDPVIFGVIYVGAIPFFTLCLAWTVRNLRQKRPVVLPAFLTGFFFISAYLYLLVVGRNLPIWVYALIVGLVLFGIYSILGKVRQKLTPPQADAVRNDAPGP